MWILDDGRLDRVTHRRARRLARGAARAHRGRARAAARSSSCATATARQRIVGLDPATGALSIGRAPQNDVEPAVGHGGLAAARRARVHRGASGRSATTASRATGPTSTARGSRAASACATATSIRVGTTLLAYRRPEAEDSRPTQVAGAPVALTDLPADPAPGARRARAALQARRVRRARDQPGRSPTSCSCRSTRSRPPALAVRSASASSTCRRTRSARAWSPRRCSPG